jgi:hypothetical protein
VSKKKVIPVIRLPELTKSDFRKFEKKGNLKRLLTYQNPEITAKFCEQFGVSEKSARVIFQDMLRFLWLTVHVDYCRSKSPEEAHKIPDIPMLGAFGIVDEMWHIFILHSVAYAEFCQDYFGFFLHHTPSPAVSKLQIKRHNNKKWNYNSNDEDLQSLLDYVEQKLGNEVLVRWFRDYPNKFPPRLLQPAHTSRRFQSRGSKPLRQSKAAGF